ncbi:MAG TPA: PPC domain-containing protein [Pirellulales bacterium]
MTTDLIPRAKILAAAIALLALICDSARAEFPEPRFDRIRPLGVAAGSEIDVEIAGRDLDDAETLVFDRPGFTVVKADSKKFKIAVAADVPAGTYDVWAVGPQGISNPRLVLVAHGLTQSVEKEPNADAATANPIPLDALVLGDADGNNVDVFRLPAKKGQRVVFDLLSTRLDTSLDGNLSLAASDGRIVATSADEYGRDPRIDATIPADGDYFVTVNDLAYSGGQPYALVVTTLPHIENVFPRAFQAGTSGELSLFGRNLGGNAAPSKWLLDGRPLDERRVSFTAPPSEQILGRYVYQYHPTGFGADPTCATVTLPGTDQLPALDRPVNTSAPVLISETPTSVEAEPNDAAEAAQKITLPAVLSGRFDQPRDGDWYEFTVPEGQGGPHLFQVYCERIAGRADPYLLVVDAESKNEVNDIDDYGHRVKAFDAHSRDPSALTSLNEKKTYRVFVKDRYGRGGARAQYVLSIQKEPGSFHVGVIHPSTTDTEGLTLNRGGVSYLYVVTHYDGHPRVPYTIEAENLPQGVHFQPVHVIDDTQAVVAFWTDLDAPDWVGPLHLFATRTVDGKAFRTPCGAYQRVSQQGSRTRPIRTLMAAVRRDAPYELSFEPDYVEATAGGEVQVKVKAVRRWADFTGPIQVNPLHVQGRFKMDAVTIRDGQTETTATIKIQPGGAIDLTTLFVVGDAQVPFARKPGEAKKNERAALASRPLNIRVREAAK